MTENTNQETANTEEPTLTEEQLAEIFKSIPGEIQKAITETNAEIDDHNKKVDSVVAAEKKDPKLIKAEIFEQNPHNNKKLEVLRKKELQLIEQIEKIRTEAYKVIDDDGLMPSELTEDQIKSLKDEITESTKNLRAKVDVLAGMEAMLPMYKGKLTIHVKEIKTRRGTAKTGTGTGRTGEGPKRLRFKRIEINGVTEDDKGNTVWAKNQDGEAKYTFTAASNYLKKQHKGINYTSKDLTDSYLKGLDENNLPEKHEFVMPYTFKDDNGNEHTVNYTVTAYR